MSITTLSAEPTTSHRSTPSPRRIAREIVAAWQLPEQAHERRGAGASPRPLVEQPAALVRLNHPVLAERIRGAADHFGCPG